MSLASKLPRDTVHALAREVVERLPAQILSRGSPARLASPGDVTRLAQALVSSDPEAGASIISGLREDGTSISDLYLLYLAAAARQLGEEWVSGELTFAEVTFGTARILAIMRGLRTSLDARWRPQERLALFASVPDEQHTIGITMAADLFRQEGWEIELVTGVGHDEILGKVSQSDAMVVGLTAHGKKALEALLKLVLAIRVTNPTTYVLVSGNIVDEAADILSLTGADAFAADIPTGLRELNRLHELAQSTA